MDCALRSRIGHVMVTVEESESLARNHRWQRDLIILNNSNACHALIGAQTVQSEYRENREADVVNSQNASSL